MDNEENVIYVKPSNVEDAKVLRVAATSAATYLLNVASFKVFGHGFEIDTDNELLAPIHEGESIADCRARHEASDLEVVFCYEDSTAEEYEAQLAAANENGTDTVAADDAAGSTDAE